MPSQIDAHSSEVAAALEHLRADPQLFSHKTVSSLHWVSGADSSPMGRIEWLEHLLGWLAQSSRMLLYVLAVLAAALLALYILRLIREFRGRGSKDTLLAPTHVRDLDIRPESLPADIGAAARALWEQGERRASLALLYRGMLSRLVHVHAIAIRESTTEGDCLDLLANDPAPQRNGYAMRLIRTWQRAVYGAQEPSQVDAFELCQGFAALEERLGPAPESQFA